MCKRCACGLNVGDGVRPAGECVHWPPVPMHNGGPPDAHAGLPRSRPETFLERSDERTIRR